MTPLEKAIETCAPGNMLHELVPADVEYRALLAALSADGKAVIVFDDGKVAELEAVIVHLWEKAGSCPPSCPLNAKHHAREDAKSIGDAAREVAE